MTLMLYLAVAAIGVGSLIVAMNVLILIRKTNVFEKRVQILETFSQMQVSVNERLVKALDLTAELKKVPPGWDANGSPVEGKNV